AFCRWLADYLLRRLHVSHWVLERWGEAPRREAERLLGPEHLRGALEQYERIFAIVRADPRLRARLHWGNGVLATTGGAVIHAWIDWPEDYRLTLPAEGVFGYLLGELLVNAIKHGAPGGAVELELEVDRGRRELSLRLRNPVAEGSPSAEHGDKAYGGRAIAQELARLCGWSLSQGVEDRAPGPDDDAPAAKRFCVHLVCAVTQQREAGEVD
ncbi:MAG: sensor histidine kinase, partial [Myxococcales bacterium]|nr:sensor histidine kinase [Myxococcales bacterium]